MLSVTGLINIDISDFKTVIYTQRFASVGMAKAKNASYIEKAVNRLLDNPLVVSLRQYSVTSSIYRHSLT
ncbi:hypothetical protein [Shewanella sp. S1-49-MNA-CIBAN-0167]|uniref:hypothetical protein n=1 Tax=Shewanella sp. S1-49-MNA-CIBAN-0167 TaxID=3140468 RepID=UPI00332F857C